MENEFFDEPRKCPNCGVVTYCDGCPTCGKKLPRSPMSRWKQVYGNHVAGEDEDVLQPTDLSKLREHIDIRDTHSSRRVFEEAEHIEPKVNFHRKTFEPSHPYFKNREGNVNNNAGKNITKIIAIVVAIAVLFIVISTRWENDSNSNFFGSFSGEIEERTSLLNGNGDILLYDYNFGDGESTFQLENTGDRSFVGEINLFRDDQLVGYYSDILIMPNEAFEFSVYCDDVADSYEFLDYQFYDIKTPKPDFEFSVFNNYGDAEITTDETLTKSDVEALVLYFIEASSYGVDDELYYMDIIPDRGSTYEVYIDNDLKEASVFEIDSHDDIKDTFTIQLSKDASDLKGTTL